MNVIVTVSRAERGTYMKTFTIDADNNISVFASKKEAVAATATPFDPFTSQSELADLATDWPMSRLVEVWNGIPGVTAVTKFTNKKIATERIWKAIENLGASSVSPKAEVPEAEVIVVTPAVEAAEPLVPEVLPEAAIVEVQPEAEVLLETVSEQPQPLPATDPALAVPVGEAGAPVPDVSPVAADSAPKPARTKRVPQKALQLESTGPREGSKTAQVVILLQREGGATLTEIMEKFGWQKHTVRGFMAGAMKKAGYAVESFKPEGGERSYRIYN
jgi:hypothetical protein